MKKDWASGTDVVTIGDVTVSASRDLTLISVAGTLLVKGTVAVAGSAIPLGLLLAVSMIVAVVILTGFYVYRSNSRFDELSRDLNREFGQ